MSQGEPDHAVPEDERGELCEALRKVLNNDAPPPLTTFLSLGRVLCDARMYYFVKDGLPNQSLPQSYAANLLHAATRFHQYEGDEAALAKHGDDLHLANLLQDILANGRWHFVRDELTRCAAAILRESQSRQQQLALFAPRTQLMAPAGTLPNPAIQLTGAQREQLRTTIVHAYQPGELRTAVAERMEFTLVSVVNTDAPLDTVVNDLIDYCDRRGVLGRLVNMVIRDRPHVAETLRGLISPNQ